MKNRKEKIALSLLALFANEEQTSPSEFKVCEFSCMREIFEIFTIALKSLDTSYEFNVLSFILMTIDIAVS